MQSRTVSSEGNITTNPTSDMEANPASVVLEGEEESFSVKYLVPMFLRAKQRLEPTEKMTPTIEAGALERGSEPMAEMTTENMMRTRSQLMTILPRAARMKEVKTGSDILMR